MNYTDSTRLLNPSVRKDQSLASRVLLIVISLLLGALVIGIKARGLGNLWLDGSDVLLSAVDKVKEIL